MDGNVPAGYVPLSTAESLHIVLSAIATLWLMANKRIALNPRERALAIEVLFEFLEAANDEIPKA